MEGLYNHTGDAPPQPFIPFFSCLLYTSKRTDRAEPPEVSFARFVYIGVTQLRKPEEEVLLTPLGELMDQWELHKQFLGIAKPKREVFIEDIIPEGI